MIKRILLLILSVILFACFKSENIDSKRGNRAIRSSLTLAEDEKAGKSDFKVSYKKETESILFPELSLDFLFEKEKEENGIESGEESSRTLVMMEEDPELVAERKRREEEQRKLMEEAQRKAEEERRKMEEELAKNPPPPKPPEITFDFIGYLGEAKRKIGVFQRKGKGDIFLKREGEKVDETFIIVEIGYESCRIGFEGFEETKLIPLVRGGR